MSSEEDKQQQQPQQNFEIRNSPWQRRLTAREFEETVKFYEADQKLTTEDRIAIAKDLQSSSLKSVFVSYSSAGLGLFAPTLYNRYQKASKEPFLRAVAKNGLYKPFFSITTGLACLVLGMEYVSKYEFSRNRKAHEGTTQGEVWKTMEPRLAPYFFLYFQHTIRDPAAVMKDPRDPHTYSASERKLVHYNPPKNDQPHELSHWEQIRVDNGFGSPPTLSDSAPTLNDLDTTDEPSGSTSTDNAPGSAWAKIRERK